MADDLSKVVAGAVEIPAQSKELPHQTAPAAPTPTTPVDPLQKVQEMFLAAAEADRAMSETFTKLVNAVMEIRTASVATANNVLSLILRLGDQGVIALSDDEYKSFGLKPKAAKIRAGK